MLLLKVLASFIAFSVVLAAPVPTGQLGERSVGLLEDAYPPKNREEECRCAHEHSLKSVDTPYRRHHGREGRTKFKHYMSHDGETPSLGEIREMEKRGLKDIGRKIAGFFGFGKKRESFIQNPPPSRSPSPPPPPPPTRPQIPPTGSQIPPTGSQGSQTRPQIPPRVALDPYIARLRQASLPNPQFQQQPRQQQPAPIATTSQQAQRQHVGTSQSRTNQDRQQTINSSHDSNRDTYISTGSFTIGSVDSHADTARQSSGIGH